MAAATDSAHAAPASFVALPANPDFPVYPTALPPPQTLHYALRRGELQGDAVLSWEADPAAPSYRMAFEARGGAGLLFRQISVGGIDAAGLAPVRFTDQRPRGSTRAVNFQRDRGVVSFSGRTTFHALQPGMQDRLSWLVQLAAVVDADPLRAVAGAEARLAVVGVGGEADAWTFVSAGPDPAEGGTLRLVREPQRAWDLRVEVWLDPVRHHLPLRARLGTWPAGTPLELSLVRTEPSR